jgi:hypothetical protein
VCNTKDKTHIHSHKQKYYQFLVTGFGYLLAIIRPKNCVAQVQGNIQNVLVIVSGSRLTGATDISAASHILKSVTLLS